MMGIPISIQRGLSSEYSPIYNDIACSTTTLNSQETHHIISPLLAIIPYIPHH